MLVHVSTRGLHGWGSPNRTCKCHGVWFARSQARYLCAWATRTCCADAHAAGQVRAAPRLGCLQDDVYNNSFNVFRCKQHAKLSAHLRTRASDAAGGAVLAPTYPWFLDGSSLPACLPACTRLPI